MTATNDLLALALGARVEGLSEELRKAFATGAPLAIVTREGYPHEGIPFPDGTVVHASKRHGQIVRTSFAKFAEGAVVQVLWDLAVSDAGLVWRRARDSLGVGYDLWEANCQHFVRYCQGLEIESPAIQKLVIGSVATATAVAAKDPRAMVVAFSVAACATLAPKRPLVGAGVGLALGLLAVASMS